MTGVQMITALHDNEVRAEVQQLLGLPQVAAMMEELAVAQSKTEAAVKELSAEVRGLSAEVRALATAQAKTDERLQALERLGKETRTAVGALSDNVGFHLEDLASIVLPDVLQARRKVQIRGLMRRFVTTSIGEEELDLFGEGYRNGMPVVVVGEVKSRIDRAEVQRFVRRMDRLYDRFGGRSVVVPVMFGFVVHPSATEAARHAGILAVPSRPSGWLRRRSSVRYPGSLPE